MIHKIKKEVSILFPPLLGRVVSWGFFDGLGLTFLSGVLHAKKVCSPFRQTTKYPPMIASYHSLITVGITPFGRSSSV